MGMALIRRLVKLDSRLEIHGLHDPNPESVRNGLQEAHPDAVIYDSYQELVKAADIDWVMISSWNCYHKEQVIAAFRAGKHVFCQKPLATNLSDCVSMCLAWRESGKMFNIGFTLRYSPHYRRIRQLLDEGTVGRIISMELNETLDFNHGGYIMGDWRRLQKYAGTHLLEKCCHDIDLANWMVDSMVTRVASFGGLNFFTPDNEKHIKRIGKNRTGVDAYSTWRGLVNLNSFTSDKDIIDNQVAIIEYADGVRATFHTNCNAGIPERRMYILGSEGAIRANVLDGTIEVKRIGFDTLLEDESTGARGGHGDGDNVLAEELAQSMIHGAPPSAGLEEGLRSAIVCFAIDEAMETGRVVDVGPYWQEAGLA